MAIKTLGIGRGVAGLQIFWVKCAEACDVQLYVADGMALSSHLDRCSCSLYAIAEWILGSQSVALALTHWRHYGCCTLTYVGLEAGGGVAFRSVEQSPLLHLSSGYVPYSRPIVPFSVGSVGALVNKVVSRVLLTTEV